MAVVRSVSLIAAVAAFFLAVVIRAADVTITSFECDSGLNVTAYDFEMDCYPHDGYCMMGQDVTLSGNSKWLRWRVTSLGIWPLSTYYISPFGLVHSGLFTSTNLTNLFPFNSMVPP